MVPLSCELTVSTWAVFTAHRFTVCTYDCSLDFFVCSSGVLYIYRRVLIVFIFFIFSFDRLEDVVRDIMQLVVEFEIRPQR